MDEDAGEQAEKLVTFVKGSYYTTFFGLVNCGLYLAGVWFTVLAAVCLLTGFFAVATVLTKRQVRARLGLHAVPVIVAGVAGTLVGGAPLAQHYFNVFNWPK